jgi:predicted AlkP superfamily pyrophosphatase or phosphodiesterase
MTTYKLVKNMDNEICAVNRSDGWSIPFDPANTDYQAYLEWVAEGNQPLPAEETE